MARGPKAREIRHKTAFVRLVIETALQDERVFNRDKSPNDLPRIVDIY